ncbi:hypothetical protein A966_02003 [Brachyspira hampsonii 30446]|uniref:Serpentine_recp domain containing protein n=1 Tax=Brachyspira hampsonii 30446 TaxID=1289135 RepID=A0A2U4FEQ0_9SPIR|nr:hypothetical protein [Brachyspira hampsonii]EKV58054.1 hypothetical protein A966_02003 [Brachyspira hampsonii 30446]MBW5395520.1 hypothetical protein [Brachyspira hampsonii]OEJ16748.1 hypothetical protein A9495_08640 [Brachyspira hampsonii]
MKKVKQISLVIVLVLSVNIKVFAASGFEASLNVPLGASFGIIYGKTTSSINTKIGFDAGVKAQIGYMFDFGRFGLSILGDLGYGFDSYRYSINALNNNVDFNFYLHNFQIGILPKFNFGSFAIGIGGGIKIPFSGTIETEYEGSYAYNASNKVNYNSSYFKSNIIGYVKITFDQYFFFNDKFSFVLGSYIGYDIGLSPKVSADNRIDSFDVGIQLGLRFAPKIAD